jgi:sugar O-acyltransferase (sialic acid O-acetyltransferase NeuD family)
MKQILIIGSGDHARVVFYEIIKNKNYKVIGFVDNKNNKKRVLIKFLGKNFYYMGNLSNFLKKNKKKNFYLIIAIGDNNLRKKVDNDIKKINKEIKYETVISKDCIINGDLVIGTGSIIMSGVVINNGSKIGNHCFINTSASIDHDNRIEDFSSIGPGVITGGNVTIKKNTYIGIGAVIKHGVEIGKNTVIGGNSFVNKKCLDNSLYFGTPVKKIKSRKKNSKYL